MYVINAIIKLSAMKHPNNSAVRQMRDYKGPHKLNISYFTQCFNVLSFFYNRFFFHGHWPLPLPPADKHSDIYLQLCTGDDYHIFLIATLVFTRLLLDEIYHVIELLFDWLMVMLIFVFLLVDLILGFVTAIWHEKQVDSNLHRLSSLYYKQTD